MTCFVRAPILRRARDSADALSASLARRPVKALDLRALAKDSTSTFMSVPTAVVLDHISQVTTRIAQCYQSLSDAAVVSKIQQGNAYHLRWLKELTLREFSLSVALERVGKDCAAKGTLKQILSHRGGGATGVNIASPASSSIRTTRRVESGPVAHVSSTSSISIAEQNSQFTHRDLQGGCRTTLCDPAHTSEKIEEMLRHGDYNKLDHVPYHELLDILCPKQSILDIVVNETVLNSDALNEWFAIFCQRRIGWRVLHAHLQHIACPHCYPRVIAEHVEVATLLHEAVHTVKDMYAAVRTERGDCAVSIDIVHDEHIRLSAPAGTRLGSACDVGALLNAKSCELCDDRADCVVAVADHLRYTFREILKNACLATAARMRDIRVTIRYALDANFIVVDFVDHAGGIAEQHHKEIWKFGWTSKSHCEASLGGLGVGLPMSRLYTSMWGGYIHIYTEPGKGTTVRVCYPRTPTEQLIS